ncbi:DNA internalization-related competence protein ComEC/Rec2 [Chitinilyticum litopenaei]|uniref:DNA internalization-related competence protein ComEC/Rec2 n=1 Tax=Chitinilyticum litopenaei TaxID=1121276 RepID=UPI00041DE56C|nr:DNA internalization-related competence protein ComEC/Rec2 [Chitinilyticum litopenaei]
MLLPFLLRIAAFAAGILLLHQQASLPAWQDNLRWLIPILALLAWRRSRPLAVLLLCLLLGFAWACEQARWRLAERLPMTQAGSVRTVDGHISDLPQATQHGQRFLFRISPAVADLPELIQVRWYGQPPPLAAGQSWRLTLRLRPPHGSQNPGAFDTEAWLLQQGIGASATVRHGERLTDRSWHAPVNRLREALREHLRRQLGDAPYRGIVIALVMGDQGGIPPEQWQRFADTGITHLVSISGLHITLLAALAATLVRRGWRCSAWLCARYAAPRAGLLAGVLVAILYSTLAGMSIPTQRTLLMLLVAAWGLWRIRPLPASAVWATALGLVLLLDPFAVLSPGFWLSFMAVGALLWAGSRGLGPAPRWRDWALSQWAATLATAPLLLLWFGQLPLYSPLANAFAIPLVSMLVTPLALLGAIEPSGTLLWLAERLLAGMDWLLMQIAGWPGATHAWSIPPAWALLPAAAGIALLLAPRGLPARWLGGFGLLPALAGSPQPTPEHAAYRVIVLDVGQGLAVLVQTRNQTVLFDTGPAGSERSIQAVLRQQGMPTPQTLVLSHNDNDHVGAAQSWLARQPPARLWHGLPASHALLQGQMAQPCAAGTGWRHDGVDFRWLWPPAGFQGSDNAGSCVLLIDNGRQRVLIPADIGQREESRLLDGPLPDVDVLLAGHHGSKTSSGADWIARLAPEHVVYSAGFLNRFRHPHPDTLARFAAQGSQPWLTASRGAILIDADDHLRISAWRALRPRYWYTAGDCATTPDCPP